MPRAFLSYARSDAKAVDRIAKDLRSQGIEVWMDREDLVAGREWLTQIEQALVDADFILVFISHASLQSVWVQKEYQAAFLSQERAGGTRVIPVLLEGVDLPPFLATIQYVDLAGDSYYNGLRQLLRTMRAPAGPRPGDIVDRAGLAKEVAAEVAKILGLEAVPRSGVPAAEIDPKLVFVITAFLSDMDPIFEGVEQAGESLGLTVMRVKDVPGDYKITDQIVHMIKTARLVVADLTHERPNVYFELGYARGLGKTVVTVAREGTVVHFDVKDWTYIPYIDSRILERDIRKRFEFELSRA